VLPVAIVQQFGCFSSKAHTVEAAVAKTFKLSPLLVTVLSSIPLAFSLKSPNARLYTFFFDVG